MSPSVPLSGIPALPCSAADHYEFKLVGEGASNVVFEVVVQPNDESSSSIFQGNLLRVPKAGTKAHTYVELQEYWEAVVKPLFEPEDLVQHRLVHLGGEQLVLRLNAVLAKNEDIRRPDFRGSRVAAAEYGMLVEDMRQRQPNDLTLEFKPKWLAQSPNAPPSATRCRNCAREALKHHTKHTNHRDSPPILCPLDFLTCATSPAAFTRIADHLCSLNPLIPSPKTTHPAQYSRLLYWLQTNTVLPRLRAAQLDNDGQGPLQADAHDPKFQLAMTLRDCTCFIRVPYDPALPVEAKLADLDKKNWAAKLGYWQAMERRLIEGGYYEGREAVKVRTDCQLERGIVNESTDQREGS
ncbi:inositol pentakisphosphate 2-kinase-like protein [Parathielavia appendiculata]|uniref:Inositol-pentakisphosphate 2-kinase n=1 Tax=Parathielavia appendiculata TaxID=2587402 RepID=A0AAN6TZ87_9PEZI|nr:inositol pentakisphosphate 2-kinase-like protein [Parathielavia appendiculata]